MIKLDTIRLQRGSKLLLEQASTTLYTGQKIALIGANGTGKSSVFQLLLGELQIDDGHLQVPRGWNIAHMAQEVAVSTRLALDYVIDGDQQLRNIEAGIKNAEQQSSVDPKNSADQLVQLHEQLDNIDGYNANVRAAQLLQGLGFSHNDTQRPVNSFSGGWRIRLNLAQALMSRSDLLLLDEPTNHLDLDAELWLEQWLQRYKGNLLLISHDRDFIDSVCEGIIHIEHQKFNAYKGNYSAFERQRAERLAQQQASFEKQQVRKQEIHRFVSRFRAQATKAKQAQSRLKELERMEDIAPAHVDSPFDFSFPPPGKFSDPLLNIQQGFLGYKGLGYQESTNDDDTVILSRVSLSIHPGSRIGFLGANGAGKSTLVKTLAKEIPMLAGDLTQGDNMRLGYFSQHQLEALDLSASPALHLQRIKPSAREQEIRNFLGGFNFHGDMALSSIECFSGGEKARLALAIIVWQNPNILLLDEPTNHLDLEMCHALTVALQAFEGAVIIVSHDRHLLRSSVEQFYLVANGKVELFDGDLNDYSRWLLDKKRLSKSNDKNKEGNGKENSDDAAQTLQAATLQTPKKQQRQSAAELRKKLNPINNAIKKVEHELSQLERSLSEVESKLADSDVYESENKTMLQDLLIKQSTLTVEKEAQEERWLALNAELEVLQKA